LYQRAAAGADIAKRIELASSEATMEKVTLEFDSLVTLGLRYRLNLMPS
jgi:hypothetical protein